MNLLTSQLTKLTLDAYTDIKFKTPAGIAWQALLNPTELTRDPRARRQALAALARGWEVVGLCRPAPGEQPLELPGVRVIRVGRERVVQQSGWTLTTPTSGYHQVTLGSGGSSAARLCGERKG